MIASIRHFQIEDCEIIQPLFPEDWHFDFISFIKKYLGKEYFNPISLLVNNKVAGYGNIIIFGNIGWLGNIVVNEEYRNKGLGTKVTLELTKIGEKAGVKTFNLVATELGEFVYKKLGFERELLYEFYIPPEIKIEIETSAEIRDINTDHFKFITELDYLATGERRVELLKNFLQNAKVIFDLGNEIVGFYLSELAKGFIVSKDKDAGLELMKLMINESKNIVIADKNIAARELLLRQGYRLTKSAPRMVLGKRNSWKPEYIFSRASGYIG